MLNVLLAPNISISAVDNFERWFLDKLINHQISSERAWTLQNLEAAGPFLGSLVLEIPKDTSAAGDLPDGNAANVSLILYS